jgi:hypothetical protein
MPSVVPPPETVMYCPPADVLSGVPAAAEGQLNVTPSAVTVAPGEAPAAVSACADKLAPLPSKFPGAVSVSLDTPTLSKEAASEPYRAAGSRPICAPPRWLALVAGVPVTGANGKAAAGMRLTR